MERCWWIPASAGMTDGWGGNDGRGGADRHGGLSLRGDEAVLVDSRFRGNDGWAGRTGTGACPYAGMKRCWWVPASAGMTVEGAGKTVGAREWR